MRGGIPAGLLALLIALPSWAAAVEPGEVGPLGEPARLRFEGNKTFAAEEIRTAVAKDVRLLLASHPGAPLTPYLRLLEEQIVAGYRGGGFPDVTVSTSVDVVGEKAVVVIREGKRYTCGEIIFEGAEGLPVEAVKRIFGRERNEKEVIPVLRKDHLPPSTISASSMGGPVWLPGEPVNFSGDLTARVRARLNDAILAEAARLDVRFDVEFVRCDSDGAVNLVIRFHDFGKRLAVSDVRFTGNQRDSREAILRFLSLEEGKPFPDGALKTLEADLYDSGRFQSVDVSVSIPRYGDNREITVAVVDHDGTPALSEPLSEAARALLRFREWAEDPGRWGGDLVIRFRMAPSYGIAPLVVLGQDGGFGIFKQRVPASSGNGIHNDGRASEPEYWSLALDEQTAVWAPGKQCRFAGKVLPFRVKWVFHLVPTFKPGSAASPRLLGGCISRGIPSNYQNAYRPYITLKAPAILRTLKKVDECRTEEGVLHLRSDLLAARIDSETGRLIDLNLSQMGVEYLCGFWPAKGATIAIVPQALADEVAAASGETEGLPNKYDPSAPISGFIRVGCDIFASTEMARRIGFRIADSIEGSPIDDVLRTALEDWMQRPVFWIPPDPGEEKLGWFRKVILPSVVFVAARTPREEWPWKLGYFVAAESMKEETQLLAAYSDFLQNENHGPLAYWAACFCLFENWPLAGRLADEGLTRLNEEAFLRDLAPFWNERGLPGTLAFFGVRFLQSLEPDELEHLQQLAAPYAPFRLDDTVKYVREHQDTPPGTFIRELGRVAWASGLENSLRESLKGLRKHATEAVKRDRIVRGLTVPRTPQSVPFSQHPVSHHTGR